MTSATSSPIVGKESGQLLAVDTSTAVGSLALSRIENGALHLIQEVQWQKKAMHSESATLELSKLLAQNQTSVKDLSHFALNIGPGSFTGLRVGINLVRTLAYSFDRPTALFSSLEVLAFKYSQEGETVTVASKAVQNFYYAATYRRVNGAMQTLVPPHSSTREELESAKASRHLVEGITKKFSTQTSAQDLLPLVYGASFFSWKDVKPLYVRGSEAEEKMKKGLLKPLS